MMTADGYEVEFSANNKEYDYDIKALTGKILSADQDDDDDDDPTLPTYIGKDNAVKAALNHAGVSASAIRDPAELDKDDGRWIYEVEFKANGFEYDYDIDAPTGKVLSADKDDIDDDDDDDDDYYPTQPTSPFATSSTYIGKDNAVKAAPESCRSLGFGNQRSGTLSLTKMTADGSTRSSLKPMALSMTMILMP